MILLLASLALADVLVEGPVHTGQSAELRVVDDLSRPVVGTTVRVVYREGLIGETEVTAGTTDARGSLHWAPERAGRVRIRAGRHDTVLRVDGPKQAKTLTLLALLLLFGMGALIASLPTLLRRS